MDKFAYLQSLLAPLGADSIEIEDESHKHAGHYEDRPELVPSHIKLTILAKNLENKNLISKHKLINDLLKPAFEQGLHAVSIKFK